VGHGLTHTGSGDPAWVFGCDPGSQPDHGFRQRWAMALSHMDSGIARGVGCFKDGFNVLLLGM
jgi:hypothetical protein